MLISYDFCIIKVVLPVFVLNYRTCRVVQNSVLLTSLGTELKNSSVLTDTCYRTFNKKSNSAKLSRSLHVILPRF